MNAPRLNNEKVETERPPEDWRLQGRGGDYVPWLHIRDVASLGLATRILGNKTGRMHVLLSQLETAYFYTLELTPAVFDIREQFALPLDQTLLIADQTGIRHPVDPKTKLPIPLTTDFMVTIRNGLNQIDHARTVKYANDLMKPRTIQKFELERVFWEKQNISWGIVTDQDISTGMVANGRWLHPYFKLSDCPDLTPALLNRIDQVLRPLVAAGDLPLARCTDQTDENLGLTPGTSLKAVRHFLAVRSWTVDLTVQVDPSKKLQIKDEGQIDGIFEQHVA